MCFRQTFLICLCLGWGLHTQAQSPPSSPLPTEDAAEFPPLIERYILDELKAIRQDQLSLRAEMAQQIAEAKVEATDRSVTYATNTLTGLFYLITAATVFLTILGWNSLRDVRGKINEVVENRVADISSAYEERMAELEKRLKARTEEIIEAQEQIAMANNVQSLWMRSGLETSLQAKIEIYDQILRLRPEDVDALSYKADAALELGEPQWALNLINRAIMANEEYSNAFWQRACVYAVMEQTESAIQDLRKAIELTPTLAEEINSENALKTIQNQPAFQAFMQEISQNKPKA